MRIRRLRRAELPTTTVELARYLIGMLIVSDILEGETRAIVRIVETEAYVVGDAASHSFRGKTARNATMFARRGHAYVYFIYGTSFCFNVSSEADGVGEAVLVRAAEPLAGIAAMRARRGDVAERDLCRGPGRLARALGITRAHDGTDLCAPGPLRLAAPLDAPNDESRIVVTARIGLTRDIERPLRFVVAGSPFASGPHAGNLATADVSGSRGPSGER